MEQCRWSAGLIDLANQVVLGIALSGLGSAMQKRRLTELQREPQMASQVGDLRFPRGEPAVVVESCFANGNYRSIGGQGNDLVPSGLGAFRHVRMDAN